MIDLFEHYDKLPPEIRRIIFSWDKSADPYQECERLLYKLKPHGYTFDYGLDGTPYDLRKINPNQ